MKKSLHFLILAVFVPLFAQGEYDKLESYEPWPDEAVDAFVSIPVQFEGRIMPLGTFAFTQLMTLRGKSSLKFETADGESHKIEYDAWLMDMFFRPHLATKLPIFKVDDHQAVNAIGATSKGRKRDDYSYVDILPARKRLSEMAQEVANRKQEIDRKIEAAATRAEREKINSLSRIDEQVLRLGQQASQYEFLASTLAFAKPGNLINDEVLTPEMQEMARNVPLAGLLERIPETSIAQLRQEVFRGPPPTEDMKTVHTAMSLIVFYNSISQSFRLFPPHHGESENWLTPGDLIAEGLSGGDHKIWAVERITKLEAIASAAADADTEKFTTELAALNEMVSADAEARGEARAIKAEVTLYQGKLRKNAFVYFLIAVILISAAWVFFAAEAQGVIGKDRRVRISTIITWVAAAVGVIGLVTLSYAIGLRCFIRQRPPVTNLYDTFLFIGATGFLVGLVIEFMTRQKVAVSGGILLAFLCVLLSGGFMQINPGDNMAKVQAVLDSNYWLTIHVLVIALGYAVGLLAALAAHFGVVAALIHMFNKNEGTRVINRVFTGIVFGMICFSLIFSLVGTILGGIWANDSWGRFWGWDPKENGALMIVLWTLAIMHLRWGGHVREFGINMLTIALGGIIAFSWFGVNAMGVGLHSYGFAAGIMRALYIFWGIEGGFMIIALGLWGYCRFGRNGQKPPPMANDNSAQAA